MKNTKEIRKSIVVLVVICLLTSAAYCVILTTASVFTLYEFNNVIDNISYRSVAKSRRHNIFFRPSYHTL